MNLQNLTEEDLRMLDETEGEPTDIGKRPAPAALTSCSEESPAAVKSVLVQPESQKGTVREMLHRPALVYTRTKENAS